MDYPFEDFGAHLELWPAYRLISEAKIRWDKPPVPITNAPPAVAEALRVMHMFFTNHHTQEEYAYRGTRFLTMLRYLNAHQNDFRQAGFFLLDDGDTQAIPVTLARAVHERFCVDPMPDSVPVEGVIARANELPNEGTVLKTRT